METTKKELAQQLKKEVKTIVELETKYWDKFSGTDLREVIEESVRDTFITLGRQDKQLISNIKSNLSDSEKEYIEDMEEFGKERMED